MISDFEKHLRLGSSVSALCLHFLSVKELTVHRICCNAIGVHVYGIYAIGTCMYVYVYVLREQGLCPVSESEFFLDPEEPNVHLFHRPWLS